MKKSLNVLGTVYRVEVHKYKDDPLFEREHIIGYCDDNRKLLVGCDLTTHPGYVGAPAESTDANLRETMRHEVVHAFLAESGLNACSLTYTDAWSSNEEMVDWFAVQGPKIAKAWAELGV